MAIKGLLELLMPRAWGETKAYFYTLDLTQIEVGADDYYDAVVDNSVEWIRIVSQIGSGRATFYATSTWTNWLIPGRICVITKELGGYSGLPTERVIACFIMEDVEPYTRDGMSYIDVSGRGIEALLTRETVWSPIGEENIIAAELTEDVAAPITTAVAVGAPPGNDAVTLDSIAGMAVDDEIRIRMGSLNDGDYHVARIIAVEPDGTPANTIQFIPDLPLVGAIDNTVIVRKTTLSLDTVAEMAVNQRVEIILNDTSTFETVIVEISTAEKKIVVEDGLTGAADTGNVVSAYDYGSRTTTDVTQIMQHADDWSVTFQTGNGTAEGTAHTPRGESVFDLLTATAERTGEFFRTVALSSSVPTYELEWRRTPDSQSVSLIMYDTDEHARQVTDEVNPLKGAAFSLRGKRSAPLITRIYPSGGDQVVSLRYCTQDALDYAISKGCTVELSADFYIPDSVRLNAGVTAYGVREIRETFGDISVSEAGNLAELQAASDNLLYSAVHRLLEASDRQYYTVEAYTAVPIRVGSTIRIENNTRVAPSTVSTTDYVVLEATDRMTNGRPRCRLVLSDIGGQRRTAVQGVAQTIRGLVLGQRRVGGSGGSTRSISISAPAAPGAHDHTEYLKTDGTTTLTGNLAVAAGVTIDGVDISEISGSAHDPVTAGNDGISVTGQAVSWRISTDSPGLYIRTAPYQGASVLLQEPSGLTINGAGLALNDNIAGAGIKIAGKVLAIDLPTHSGLTTATDQLVIGTPSAVSAASTNLVTGTTHTHQVSASASPGAASQLLKTDANGYLQLQSLGVGTAPDGTTALKLASPAATWHALLMRQRSDQIAPMLRIENNAGQALVLLTSTGDLESGYPGFASGLRGWQIQGSTGDAEFNNVRVRGELHATTFVADEMHATGGTMILATATTVARGYAGVGGTLGVINSVGASDVFVTASYNTGLCYFAVGDIIRVKPMGEIAGGGSLYLPDIYLEVGSISSIYDRNLAQGKAGYYRLICTRRSGGHNGFSVPVGAAVVRWTTTVGYAPAPTEHSIYKGQMLLTADLSQSPYIDVFTVDATRPRLSLSGSSWPGSGETRTPPGIKPRVRLGNLDGVLGLSEQWGIAAGTDLTDTAATAKYIVASEQGVILRNVQLDIYSGASVAIKLNPTDGIRLLNSDNVYAADRSLKWVTAAGTGIGVVSAMQDASGNRFIEMGINPTYGFTELTAAGIQIEKFASGVDPERIHLNADLVTAPDVSITGAAYASEGLAAGGALSLSATATAPGDNNGRGRILLQESTGASTPAAGHVTLGLHTVGGVQKLYARFANGVYREIASA
jgi:hypothetical protein